MDLKEIMQQKVFAVVGDTLNEEKYACKIKNRLIENGYEAYGVYKEAPTINDIEKEIDIIVLCINAVKGLQLMKDCKKNFKCIVIQPGAESEELISYLEENHLPYIEGCVLVGLSLYASERSTSNN